MADTVSKNRRSQIMSLVKSKDTKLEIKFRKTLRKLGYKFRTNSRSHFGKPDIVLKKYKTVIFIDSCFWHGCVKHCRLPSSGRQYWVQKIARNKARDIEVKKYYKKTNWKIIRIWEHSFKNLDKIIMKIRLTSVNHETNRFVLLRV